MYDKLNEKLETNSFSTQMYSNDKCTSDIFFASRYIFGLKFITILYLEQQDAIC